MDLRQKNVVITGASRGIGAAVARAVAARGARVGLLARSRADLEKVLTDCKPGGVIVEADMSKRADVERAIERVRAELGQIDVLVNNAGIGQYGLIADTDIELFERIIEVNYLGTVYATKAVLPEMLARKNGHIVNIASINGRIGAPLEGAYSASKFAVAGFTDTLMLECAFKGIGVSLVNPGPVKTDFFDARGAPYMRPFPKPVSPDAVAKLVVKAIERGTREQFLPRWLRFPAVMKSLAPSFFRAGTLRNFRKELR